jgi:beta-galactosidase
MDRRDFLKVSGACVAGVALSGAVATLAAEDASTTGRTVIPFNRGWRFSPARPEQGESVEFHDQTLEEITLPHSNASFSWHNFDLNAYEKVSLYRKHFDLPELKPGKRVFIDFEGAMLTSRVWVNGKPAGEYKGGYTPFTFEITKHARSAQSNLLALELDSREASTIPPFGYEVDYLTFGGIYRQSSLRIVDAAFIENFHVRTLDVLTEHPGLEIDAYVNSALTGSRPLILEAILHESDRKVGTATLPVLVPAGVSKHTIPLRNLTGIQLWSIENPHLYSVRIRLYEGSNVLDQDDRTVGFRSAEFTEKGFYLNGRHLKLRGLNRHQTYPYVGSAMPRRVQRRDAEILKKELKCNIVRTSHYPPSRHFMDACDEFGVLVLEEIPGWQHVGDRAWQDLAADNVRKMIERDWNRPSVVLWSIRINESRDFHDFYVRTNALARQLDPTRPTCGVRYFQESEFLEDVFCMNDFGIPLKTPNHARYLNTEFVGAEWPVHSWDNNNVHKEHILRYAKIYDQLETDERYSGGLGWCAFDYPTHPDFGSGDHLCYHGVMDIFREPKPAAGFYKAQCSTQEEVVLEAGFHFAMNDESGGFKSAPINSNCDLIKCLIGHGEDWHEVIELKPDREQFPHLAHPPFFLTLPNGNDDWGDLRLDGYVGGELKITKKYSSKGIDQDFRVKADDTELFADGSDATRVVLRATDEYGNVRTLSNAPVSLKIEGPGKILGPSLLSLVGGVCAVWIQATEAPGTVTLTSTNAEMGERKIAIQVKPLEQKR